MIVQRFVLFAILSASVASGTFFRSSRVVEDAAILTTPQLASEWGYDVEEHDVITEDGYILTNFRVKRKNSQVPLDSNVLLLLSGLGSSSDHYFLMAERPLVFNLVDDGYDVWLGNVRGTRYGKRHKNLSPNDVAFWDFSYHEMGVYDVPAAIDYVLDRTNNTKLGFGGYSQGTTIFFVTMSEKPEYNEKVAVMLAIAPVVYFRYTNNIALKILALYGTPLLELAMRTRFMELLTLDGPGTAIFRRLCSQPQFFATFCRPLLLAIAGSTNNGQNDNVMRRIMSYGTSTSLKVLVHYGQGFSSGKFQRYRYPTPAENLAKYGSLEPPEYNIKNTKMPVIMIVATGDRLASIKDVEDLRDELPNVLHYQVFPYRYFGHYSMIGARNSSKYIYKTQTPLLSKVSFH